MAGAAPLKGLIRATDTGGASHRDGRRPIDARRRHAQSAARRLALACALALLGAPGASSAGKSHLLQKPERHVVLTSVSASGVDQCASNWDDRILVEVGPDGSAATEEFVVPAGHVLVVTELDWRTTGSPNSLSPGRVHSIAISLGPNPGVEVFRSATVVDADLAAAGIWLGSASLTTGFRVSPGVPICPRAYSNTSSTFFLNSVTSLIVRGYLVKSK